jgi:hypothetical protein
MRKVLVPVALSMLLAAALLLADTGPAADPASAAAPAACTAATNVEAIVDDSGSMLITDADRLRVQAIDLLIQTLPQATRLGAVEFGSGLDPIPGVFEGTPASATVFTPEPIGPNAAAMAAALKADIKGDDGLTDYNAAFARADADDPDSQARIFLTDGAHNEGAYAEAHLSHKVPTYVIGFGTGIATPEAKARLKKIAADTGGAVYDLQDSSELQAVVNSIGAELTCQAPPRQFTDQLAQGQSKTHAVAVGAKTRTLRVTLTWAQPGNRFKLTGLRIKSHGKKVKASPKATLAAKSSTFNVFKVTHLRPGTLSFGVKAAKAAGKVKVTTQVGGESR